MECELMPNDNVNKALTPMILEARQRLREDAERAAAGCTKELTVEWIDPILWEQYIGKNAEALYLSFSDQELLDILRNKAAELGRNPSQQEIFCVFRMYIRRRFTNWPRALAAAGLKDRSVKKKSSEHKYYYDYKRKARQGKDN